MDMHSFEGPATWDEVDMQDLDKVMLRVTSAAMPSTDNKELASRLAMQSAAHEAENSDPLGLGQIDSRQINLVRLCLLTSLPCTLHAKSLTISLSKGKHDRPISILGYLNTQEAVSCSRDQRTNISTSGMHSQTKQYIFVIHKELQDLIEEDRIEP